MQGGTAVALTHWPPRTSTVELDREAAQTVPPLFEPGGVPSHRASGAATQSSTASAADLGLDTERSSVSVVSVGAEANLATSRVGETVCVRDCAAVSFEHPKPLSLTLLAPYTMLHAVQMARASAHKMFY